MYLESGNGFGQTSQMHLRHVLYTTLIGRYTTAI